MTSPCLALMNLFAIHPHLARRLDADPHGITHHAEHRKRDFPSHANRLTSSPHQHQHERELSAAPIMGASAESLICRRFQSGSAALRAQHTRRYRTFCEVLAEVRDAHKLTQRQLAARLKRPRSFVGKIETGERRLDVVEFIDLARALRMTPHDLLTQVLRRIDQQS